MAQNDDEFQNKPAHAVPLASARLPRKPKGKPGRPFSPERAVEGQSTMAQKGTAELIFRGRREQKAAFPPYFLSTVAFCLAGSSLSNFRVPLAIIPLLLFNLLCDPPGCVVGVSCAQMRAMQAGS